jgi:hypothetical protein
LYWPIGAESPEAECVVTEGINTFLGDVDAPDCWHYRRLQLVTTGEAVTDLQLAHHQI